MRPYVELFDDEFVVMPNHVHRSFGSRTSSGCLPPVNP
jgi:hypothetical protein